MSADTNSFSILLGNPNVLRNLIDRIDDLNMQINNINRKIIELGGNPNVGGYKRGSGKLIPGLVDDLRNKIRILTMMQDESSQLFTKYDRIRLGDRDEKLSQQIEELEKKIFNLKRDIISMSGGGNPNPYILRKLKSRHAFLTYSYLDMREEYDNLQDDNAEKRKLSNDMKIL